jgi:O-antigen ligase
LLTTISTSYLILPSNTQNRINERVTLKSTKPFNPWAIERNWIWKVTSGRIQIWENSFDLILEKPLLGHGIDNAAINLTRGTHNEYLAWLVNFGVFGFFLYSIIYIKIFNHIKYHFNNSNNLQSKVIYLGYLSGFLGYIIAMFGSNFFEPRYIFWIYTALIYKYAELDSNECR